MSCLLLNVCLLLCNGCRPAGDRPASGGETAASDSADSPPAAPAAVLTDRVWVRSDTRDLPGVMRVFLRDGTMLLDSCWETYRLAKWRMEPDQTLIWNEDGVDIRAVVVVLNEGELVLRLDLASGAEEQHYEVAPAPYVCPDMPR